MKSREELDVRENGELDLGNSHQIEYDQDVSVLHTQCRAVWHSLFGLATHSCFWSREWISDWCIERCHSVFQSGTFVCMEGSWYPRFILGSSYVTWNEHHSLYQYNVNVFRKRVCMNPSCHIQRFYNAVLDSSGRIGGKMIIPFSKQWKALAVMNVSLLWLAHSRLRSNKNTISCF